MKIAIAGGTGFIGTRLKTFLQNDGHDIIILTRNKNKTSNHPNTTTSNKPRHERNLPQTQPASFQTDATYVSWLSENTQPEKHLHNTDIFINLAGVSINKGRWTKSHQQKIYTSRMQATNELIRIIQTMPDKPTTLINASAIGIYPTSQAEIYNKAHPTTPTNKKSTPAACKQPTNSSASSKPCQINPRHSLTQAPLASTPPHKMKYITKHHPPPRTTFSDGPYPPGNKKPNKQSNTASAPAL